MIKAEGLYSFGDSASFSSWPDGIRRGSARGSADNAEHSHHQAEDHTEQFLHSSPNNLYT